VTKNHFPFHDKIINRGGTLESRPHPTGGLHAPGFLTNGSDAGQVPVMRPPPHVIIH
jgi:hypothetical protein